MLNFRSLVILIALYIPVLAIGQCDTTLIISEYSEGGTNDKCIEIFNPFSSTINFNSGLDSILIYENGDVTIESDNFIALSGSIPALGTFVLCRTGYNTTLGVADIVDVNVSFTGDDAIALKIGGTIVDVIGTIGMDPGTSWDCGEISTNGSTLIRRDHIYFGNSSGFMGGEYPDPLCMEWIAYDDAYSELGMHAFNPRMEGVCPFDSPIINEAVDGEIIVCDGESTKIDLTDQASEPVYTSFASLDFESEQGYTTSSGEFNIGGNDFFIRTNGSDLDEDLMYINADGYWFGVMDNDASSRSMTDSIIIDPIDITGRNNLRFSIELAEDDDGSMNDWDATDFVRIFYKIDDGGYQPLIFVSGSGTNTPPQIDTDFDGLGDGAEITEEFTEFQANIPAIGMNLDLLIVVSLDAGDEDIAMDNIEILEGDIPATSFNFYDGDPFCGGNLLAGNVLMYDPPVNPDNSPFSLFVTTTSGLCETAPTEVTIIVNPLPTLIPEALDSLVCIGDQIDLSETGGDADEWIWSGPVGFADNGDMVNLPNAAFENAGVYQVVGTITDTQCTDSATIVVNVVGEITPPDISITTACTSESAKITPPTTYVTITGDAKSLFFSEYIEGTSDNKCLEIFNATGMEVDLSAYSIEIYSNGGASSSNSYDLQGTLGDRMTYVICNPEADPEFTDLADTLSGSVTNYNGNDLVVLLENGKAIDHIGRIGEDPGDEWDMGGIGTMNATLIRNPDVAIGDTIGSDAFDPSAEFTDLGEDDFSNLGKHEYYGLMEVSVLFNFYDEDLNFLGGPATSYMTGSGGTFYVTSIYDDCESENAAEVLILISPGIQELACKPVQVSVSADCELDFSSSLFLGNNAVPEFLVVEILDGDKYIPVDQVSKEMYGQELSYRLRDTCNQHSCWNILIIEDKRPPEMIVEPVFLECGDDYSIEALGYPEVIECSWYDITFTDGWDGDFCTYDKTILRTFNAKDEFGNGSQVVQEIHINTVDTGDVQPPLENVISECGKTTPEEIFLLTGMAEAAYPTIDGKPIEPNLFCNLTLWFEDKSIEVCDESCTFSSKIKRTWYIIDWCGGSSDPLIYNQLISAKDTTPPTLPGDTLYQTYSVDPWTCTIDQLQLPTLESNDNCSENVELIVYGPTGITVEDLIAYDVTVGTHIFEYRGVDCCGNITRDPRILIVTVRDEIAPMAIAKERVVLAVSPYTEIDGDEEALIVIYPDAIDNGSHDNCGGLTYLIRSESDNCRTDSDEYGPSVTFCCRDLPRNVGDVAEKVVWLMVIDSSGNSSETWGTVILEDKSPIEVECKDVVTTVLCYEDIEDSIEDAIDDQELKPTAFTDLCENDFRLSIIRGGWDFSRYNFQCNFGEVYVTWQVRNRPDIECVQRVTVNYLEDTFSCANIHWPEDAYKELSCTEDYTPDLTWDAGPCQLIGWNMKSDTFRFETDACTKIINEYTVIDWCLYDHTFTAPEPKLAASYVANCNLDSLAESPRGVYFFKEVIKITDTLAPVIQECVPDTFNVLNSNCTTEIILYNTALDPTPCERLPLNWELVVIGPDDRVYTYEKDGYSGEEVSFELSNIDFKGPMETYEVQWTVWDGCGNTGHCNTEITILDKKAPTPYCRDLGSALMNNGQLEIWAIDFNLDSYDNCSNQDTLRFTFDQIPPDSSFVNARHYFDKDGIIEDTIAAIESYVSGEVQLWIPKRNSSAKILTCSDLPSTVQQMTVWDEKWNYDYCEVDLSLTDSDGVCDGANIANGVLSLEDGRKIFGADLELLDSKGDVITVVESDEYGSYSFADLRIEDGSTIIASMEKIDYDGVTTQDVLILQDHILERKLLNSPFKVIGGDVNQDRTLSAIDMLLIQRRAINLTKQFTAGDWKFVVPGDYLDMEFALENAMNSIVLHKDQSWDNLNFMGIRMGDLNGDVTLGLREGLKTRSDQKITLEMTEVKKGILSEISFSTTANDVSGVQLSLDIADLVIIDLAASDPSAKVSYHIEDGILNMGYINEDSHQKGEILFTLKIGIDSESVPGKIGLNQSQIRNEIYIGDLHTAHPANLSISIIDGLVESELLRNRPNPFRDRTFIDFNLPSSGKVSFKFFAVDGKELYKTEINGLSGTNKFLIQKADLGYKSGIIYYQMTYAEQMYNGKMILLE